MNTKQMETELSSISTRLDQIKKDLDTVVKNLTTEEFAAPPPIEPQRTSPEKRALLVGINKYRPDLNCDLNGCVNDTINMTALLSAFYGFKVDNITVLNDSDATQANILSELNKLCENSIDGDELVFHFSGHGSQVTDGNGDEADGLDEIICPYDLDWNNPFTDDIIADAFKKVATNAHLTFICDSCHSGTASRNIDGIQPVRSITIEREVGGMQISQRNLRFLDPPDELTTTKQVPLRRFGSMKKEYVPNQRHIMLAACAENTYSADANIGGIWQGAHTYNFIEVAKWTPTIRWRHVPYYLNNNLASDGFEQVSQLVCSEENSLTRLFGIVK